MPRVTTVKKAQKAQGSCSSCGAKINIGDGYRWWKFRYGGRRIRCMKQECAPKASDLTQSAFYSQLYSIQESVQEAIANQDADALNSAADDLRSLGEECSSNRDNMPESLQDSETGELLQTRYDECEEKASELESLASEVEGLPDPDDWETYASDEGIERNEGEEDDAFEERVRQLIEDENLSAWEGLDIDLDIS